MRFQLVGAIALIGLSVYASASAYVTFSHPREVLPIALLYLPKNPVIIDCGAYTGEETLEMLEQWPDATIHAFEPIPDIYTRLQKRVRDYPSIHTYQVALADLVGPMKMYVSEHPQERGVSSQSSSLLKPKEHLRYSEILFPRSLTVACTTLDAWAERHGVDHVDFLWLDMQGYELPMMKASPCIMATVKVILTEVEFCEAYKDQAQYREVRAWLEQQGFEMVAFSDINQWFGDALFVRKSAQ